MAISEILETMINQSSEELDYEKLTVFDSGNIPGISLADYLTRIMTYSQATSRSLVLALSYIDKLNDDTDCPVSLNRFNIHRLLGVSIMVATKFYDEEYLSNEKWGSILGLTLDEINKLERKFLIYMNFEINTKIECFINYLQLILSFAVDKGVLDKTYGKAILKYLYSAAIAEAKDGNSEG